ncbi:FtsW/RodA/SpoVE family cell cycle protein [Duganella aceris]|uniref:Probable peptidoglycan glycosyltransferase FtsW n=1 Tax=Duganella aceris TaxID=2703883 RepID=A0ABX0FG80_9BURK|nr:FtsW/RodA/SpoVE family cell cycle protein [Duganella aceris]NGZ83540.1 FtsW/RodA/SpoVE family cell cycle protein [Duganella aceris]
MAISFTRASGAARRGAQYHSTRSITPFRHVATSRPFHRALEWLGGAVVGAALSLGRAAMRNVGMAATLGLLAALCGLQALALLRAPAAWLPSAVTVQLSAGENITLGQRELGAPQADRNHLSLRRDPQGAWMLRNLSAAKQVLLLRGSAEQRLGSLPLQDQQRFQIDGAVFEVRSADARGAAFTRDGHEWRYDGATLYRDGRAQANCPESRLSTKALALWNRAMPLALTIARPLAFGGNLYCDNRLGLPQVTPGAAQLGRVDGRLQLTAGNPDGDRAAVLLSGAAGQTDLRKQEAPLAGVTAIQVGRTRFQVVANGDQLTLNPGRNVKLFSEPELKLPQQISWQWQQRDLWQAGHANVLWLGIAICLAAIAMAAAGALAYPAHSGATRSPPSKGRAQRAAPPSGSGTAATPATRAPTFAANRIDASMQAMRRSSPWAGHVATAGAWIAAAAMLATGVIALISQRAGFPPGAACSLLLGACALLLWLALPGRLTLLSAAAIVLLAAGLLSQLELGLGAQESSWLRYYQKSTAMLAIGTGLGGLLRLWARQQAAQHAPLRQRSIEWLLALFTAIALAALAAQVLWGDETGVFDLQPVELAKLALTALTAHCLALRFGWLSGPQRGPQGLKDQGARWLQLIAPALLFLALLGLALVQVDDFSPLILLLIWSTGMAFAYATAAGNRLLAAALIACVLLAAGAVVYLRMVGTDDLIRWGFYADRFLVWLNPAEHPHTGQQLLLGARAISDGGWLGADHWLGLRSLGQAAGAVVHIPAVQDDFAASFFLNRHGLAGGLLLWLAQAAFLTGILLAALRAHKSGAAARDFRHAWAGRFRYFALCGGGAFVLGHFLLSWGTNLAIFPIMGQPMSFLSAGGSHLLFFLCPLLAFSAISAPSLEGE